MTSNNKKFNEKFKEPFLIFTTSKNQVKLLPLKKHKDI